MYKYYAILFIFSILNLTKSYSQVTIGLQSPPIEGALLDLKQYNDLEANAGGRNADKGLLLPRVELSSLITLSDIATGEQEQELQYTGLTVYNPLAINEACLIIPSGIYYWGGEKWLNLAGEKTFDAKESYYNDVRVFLSIYNNSTSNNDNTPILNWKFNTSDTKYPQFVSGDGVTFNTAACGSKRLTDLVISNVKLTKLDITNATELVNLDCS